MSDQVHDVAVILINYNNCCDTKECIESISKSSELPFIVVVDNASNDADFIENEVSFYPFLKCIISNVNLGFGGANNLAIEWVLSNLKTSYIYILNNDTVVEKETIEKLSNSLKSADDATVLAAPLIRHYADKKKIWYAGGSINFSKMVPELNYDFSATKSFFTNFASGCSMFFKTEFLGKIGGFDPFYFMYDEDVELSIRVINHGYQIIFVPAAVVYHKCQGSQTKAEDLPSNQLDPNHPSLIFYLTNTIRNRKYTIDKHLEGFSKVKAEIFQNIYWVAKSLQFFLYGKFKAFYFTLKYLLT